MTCQIRTRFDLGAIAERHRARRWTDLLNEVYYSFDCGMPEGFRLGRLDGFRADGLTVGCVAADPMWAVRSRSHLARDPRDDYLVTLAGDRPITMTQGGRVARIAGRGFAIVSTADVSSLHQPEPSAYRNLVIPGDALRRFAPRIDDLVGLAFGDRPLHAMFHEMAAAWSRDAHRLGGDARALIGENLVALLGLVIDGADHASGERVVRCAHRSRIERIIRDGHADPSFGPASVARGVGLSPRRVRSILAAQGTTATRLIREQRVARALRLPRSDLRSSRSVEEVARAVGYASVDRFHRDVERTAGPVPPLPASSG